MPRLLALGVLLGLAAVARSSDATEPATAPRVLFDGSNLDRWQVFVEGSAEPVAEQKIFQISDGAIHVYRDETEGSQQPFAMLVTKEDYSDYHLSLEYRWGEKKFAPRAEPDFPRDAGVCYHVREPIIIWPTSVECQIQFGDTGDVWAIKTQVTSTEHPDTRGYWRGDGGVEVTRGGPPLGYNRFVRSTCLEREGWNRVEVIVRGDHATHVINGQVNNEARRMKYWDEETSSWLPLQRGRILLQAEGAEILYRNVVLVPLH